MACNKRHLLITGPPGVGKTTLIKKVYEQLQQLNIETHGFYTEEVRVNNKRTGFDAVTLDGERAPLARVQDPMKSYGPKVGQYSVDVKSFENLVLPLMNNTVSSSVIIIDEIGKMELFSRPFQAIIKKLFHSGESLILATIPIKKGPSLPILEEIRRRQDVHMIEVTRENRNKEVETVIHFLQERTKKT